MNCRNVQNEIEAAGSARFLSAAVLTHIRECKHCAVTAEQQDRLQTMLANLGTVEAPSDFDFRLRARLAAGNDKQGSTFGFAIPSFALRALTAVAAFILLIGGFWIAGLRSPATTIVNNQPPTTSDSKPNTNHADQLNNVAVVPPITQAGTSDVRNSRGPRRESRNELASFRNGRSASRDEASTAAEILKKYNKLAGTEFPIDASYQNLKVSVDDGTGTARTISLPAVSFGSQRTLSQNVTPIMASNRGTW